MENEPLNPGADPAQMILASQRGAVASAIGSLDADPEAAARSMELSDATGVPALVINSNLEGFEQQHKAALTANLLNNNEYLQSFINSNPMAAKVANDDYANLDEVSHRVSALGLNKVGNLFKTSFSAMLKPPEGSDLAENISPEDAKNHPFLSAMYAGLGTPINMLLLGLQGEQEAVTSGVKKGATAIGGESFGQGMSELVDTEMMGLTGRHGGMPEVGESASRAQASGSLFKQADREKLQRVQPYVENGREPPQGIIPEYDDFRADQNKQDVDQLKEATDAAQTSAMRERYPPLFKQFIDQRTNAEIGVSGEVVAKLYGDKVPEPDDNLLGWVPGIEDKLALAKETGGDVNIPLSDWLTKAEPELMQALHDDIRVRPGGITKNEADITKAQLGKNPTEPLPDLVAQTRAAGALEPLFSVGDRKLKLARLGGDTGERLTPESLAAANGEAITAENRRYYENQAESVNSQQGKFGPAQGFHDFSLNDEKGNPVGSLNISEQKGGKQLYVDMVNGVGGLGPRDFGPALMRDLLKQLKAEFPNAETITGHRVSGARDKAGSYMAASASPVVKLDALDTQGAHENFRSILEGGQWERYSPSIQAYIKPQVERAAQDRELVNTINDELNRIVPNKVRVQGADTIAADASGIKGQQAGDSIQVGGVYMQYREAYPIILYALDSKDALGSARHEAIHHLRQYGFFTPEEWSTLHDEALAGNWFKKYRVDERYPTANPDLKLEEAIAEAYPHWAEARDNLDARARQIEQVPSPLDAIFARMKEFFDRIKEKIAGFLGKDPTWEDIFQQVHTGEVGSREGTGPIDTRAFDPKLSVEKPPEEGKTRFYHGTTAEDASEFSGKTFVSPQMEYAKNYRGNNNNVLHTDFTKDEAIQRGLWDEVNDIPINGSIDDGASRLKPLPAEASTPVKPTLPPEDGSRVFERASALGMTTDQFKAYDRLMQARHAEDVTAATKRATEEQAREQTKQWKEDRKALRQEVAGDIRQRPDVAADLFFGSGELYGKKVPLGSVKLDADVLTPEQKAGLPRQYYGEHGLHPDDVAGLFGYGSGDAMVERLVGYNQAKLAAGGMSAKDFVSRVTDIETDRQMRIKHGVLEDNIVDAVKEQVSGETQQDILHEETVALGMKAGVAPIDKGTVVGQLREAFSRMPLGSVSSDAYMRAAGKAGRQAELSLLDGDPANAFKAKQQQYYATVIANEAAKLEKELGKFDKLAKRFSKREIPTVDQEYTNFIHDILMRVGRPVRRSVQDLAGEVGAGEYKDLQSFVEGKNSFYLREVAVDDRLFDPGFRKAFEDLTVDEFRGTDMSLRSLVANGRDEKKITKAGIAEDLAVVKGQMIDQLKQFAEKTYDAKGGRWMGPIPPRIAKVLRTYGTAHIQMENLFNRWDHDNPRGTFQQYIMRDLVDAANNESVMEKRYASRLRDLDDKADLKKSVENPLFKVPGTDQLMTLTRGNLRSILLNAGNESNLLKMAKGYNIPSEQLLGWLHRHATKEDWNWAQGMGDVFGDLKKEADIMYRNLSGVAPESIKINPVDTPHGQYKGWYYPLIAHPEFEGGVKKMMGKDALEQAGFVRATTSNGYTKSRTGASYPLALDLDMLPPRMKQMIHDIAMRPSIINASKIFYDKDIRSTIQTRFGTEWRDMLIPYLSDVANSANYMPKEQRQLAQASEFMRQNLISTLVGLNPGTVLKHGPTALVQSLHEVGAGNFLKALKGLTSINDRTGETNWQFAMKTSEELQRRHQNYVETLGGATELLQPTSGFASLRSTIQRFSASPVAVSDLLSAVPTWMAQYSKSMEEGQTHGDAVYDADRAVRRAHGSIAITNRSAVMRGGALAQWMTSVYGFFNHIMNRQYELLWKSGEAIGLAKDGQYGAAMAKAPELTSMLFAYVLAPALIEEAVTPLMSGDNESWGKKAAKGVAYTLGASWVGIRDLANAVLNGRDPAIGLLQTQGKALTDFARDMGKKAPFSKEHAGKVVRDGSTMLGALTGVVPGQLGRAAQFGTNLASGQDKPKGPWGWLTGARFGTTRGHPATFQEWKREHIGGR